MSQYKIVVRSPTSTLATLTHNSFKAAVAAAAEDELRRNKSMAGVTAIIYELREVPVWGTVDSWMTGHGEK